MNDLHEKDDILVLLVHHNGGEGLAHDFNDTRAFDRGRDGLGAEVARQFPCAPGARERDDTVGINREPVFALLLPRRLEDLETDVEVGQAQEGAFVQLAADPVWCVVGEILLLLL